MASNQFFYCVIWRHRLTTNDKGVVIHSASQSWQKSSTMSAALARSWAITASSSERSARIIRSMVPRTEGLLAKLPSCKGSHPNRGAPEIVQAILDSCLIILTYGHIEWIPSASLQTRRCPWFVGHYNDLLPKHYTPAVAEEYPLAGSRLLSLMMSKAF